MIIDNPKESDFPSLFMLWQEAFGDSEEFINIFKKTAFSPYRSRCVKKDGQIIAALYWFNCTSYEKPIAYIYAVATKKAYRGQGICKMLMEDTHNHLKKLGYEGAILVPGSKALFDFYAKMGYEICTYTKKFVCSKEKSDIKLTTISKQEFQNLRREFLPCGGVIQENENLDFLEAQAEFYKGDDFLLAARKENESLYGIELLGNIKVAPKIADSLECSKGEFRTVGVETPFSMYLPLGESKHPFPSYFGFAFD